MAPKRIRNVLYLAGVIRVLGRQGLARTVDVYEALGRVVKVAEAARKGYLGVAAGIEYGYVQHFYFVAPAQIHQRPLFNDGNGVVHPQRFRKRGVVHFQQQRTVVLLRDGDHEPFGEKNHQRPSGKNGHHHKRDKGNGFVFDVGGHLGLHHQKNEPRHGGTNGKRKQYGHR